MHKDIGIFNLAYISNRLKPVTETIIMKEQNGHHRKEPRTDIK